MSGQKTTTSRGREAEDLVAEQLREQGHKILAQNWRVRRAEIDIVSQRKKTVYFTEVKFRSSSDWGGGLEYITPAKLKQMHFAAELWIAENNWSGAVELLAAEVDDSARVKIVEIA